VNEFQAFRETVGRAEEKLTAAAEDYLGMIFRLSREKGYARVSELSAALSVQPPAATRMVQRLAENKLIQYEKYGVLALTDKGNEIGEYLLQRRAMVERFLKALGVDEAALPAEADKMAHAMGKGTLRRVSQFIEFAEANPRFFAAYQLFRRQSERRERHGSEQ